MSVPPEAISAAASAIGASIGRGEPSQLIAKRALEAAAPFIAAAERQRAACCDLHGRNCEPPSELCCQDCTEVRHPRHPPGEACANPDIARRAEELHADHHSGYIVPTLEAAEDAAITGGSWLDDLARASLGAADAKFSPVTAAMKAIIAVAYDFGHGKYVGGDAGKFARAAVQAAAPLIAAAERERLREAFARVQELAGTLQKSAVERAVAAERQRIRQLALDEAEIFPDEGWSASVRAELQEFAALLDAPAKETP